MIDWRSKSMFPRMPPSTFVPSDLGVARNEPSYNVRSSSQAPPPCDPSDGSINLATVSTYHTPDVIDPSSGPSHCHVSADDMIKSLCDKGELPSDAASIIKLPEMSFSSFAPGSGYKRNYIALISVVEDSDLDLRTTSTQRDAVVVASDATRTEKRPGYVQLGGVSMSPAPPRFCSVIF
jgi:hypothetical protein